MTKFSLDPYRVQHSERISTHFPTEKQKENLNRCARLTYGVTNFNVTRVTIYHECFGNDPNGKVLLYYLDMFDGNAKYIDRGSCIIYDHRLHQNVQFGNWFD